MSDEGPLEDLAGSVSDGGSVNWDEAALGALGPGEKAAIGALREVSRIAAFNRDLQRSPLQAPEGAAPEKTGGGQAIGGGPEHWAHLTLLEKVGAGASGEVWRAWDRELQREVALKFLTAGPGDRAGTGSRLVEEARVLARVRHPAVVVVHGIAEDGGRIGMWMEYLHGPTLAEEIERRGPLPPRDVARIGLELCRALEAVAAAGLVHGDLKPANVILESNGRVVLTDFGLGRLRALDDPDSRRGSGTPIFMSPGLLMGEASTTGSDLYALGVSLRWALTGRPPFKARTILELIAEASAGPSVPLVSERPEAPRRLVAAIERAMAPDDGARFTGAAPMALELEAVLDAREATSFPLRGIAAAGAGVILVLVVWLAPRFLAPRPPAAGVTNPGDRPLAPAGSSGAAAPPSAGETGNPPATSYSVEATLIGRTGGQYRRLAAGDRVSPGDWLSLEFRASKPMWVYVLNEDERGETYLLYPQPLFDTSNPVSPDSVVVLPGTVGGLENAWRVTSRGGREHFLVVASPEPVLEIESELGRLPDARPGHPIRYAAVAPATVERLRGVGGVSPLPGDAAPRRSDAFERFQALSGRETVAQGIWIRKITLENPLK